MATNFLTTRAVSHRERVCSLYKKSLRLLESYIVNRPEYRYRAVVMRARFDDAAKELDMRKAQKMVIDGEEELFMNQSPFPFQFQYSPGGSAYARQPVLPDWILDSWAPLEKAQYPHYFARREKRKDEWIAYWHKNHNRGKPNDEHEAEFSGNYDEKPPGELPVQPYKFKVKHN
ncbi:putative NADH dehydrogenase [ubiquinone] 1 beta subcomplex subunit 9 [Hypsibius exemplaris]|uniref:NADH dehydrogenase [ubiquinone] 1 beta subcomplex subunit 9 n=1 Tax=Hypsibius exemplaris TaxID=2072580 RepID=A0A1W0X4K9_HYPEX|nr:putative NADH dehydrogenase [ubiquinone] 1 beta subcomplex subunit 9 [Hypsibius exemplaris]